MLSVFGFTSIVCLVVFVVSSMLCRLFSDDWIMIVSVVAFSLFLLFGAMWVIDSVSKTPNYTYECQLLGYSAYHYAGNGDYYCISYNEEKPEIMKFDTKKEG